MKAQTKRDYLKKKAIMEQEKNTFDLSVKPGSLIHTVFQRDWGRTTFNKFQSNAVRKTRSTKELAMMIE